MRFSVAILSLCLVLFGGGMKKGPVISFLALDAEKGWQPVVCFDGVCSFLHTELEVQSFDFDKSGWRLLYVAADRSVRIVENGREYTLFEAGNDAYTQPLFLDTKGAASVVTLMGGSSKDTKIVRFDITDPDKRSTLVHQHATVLDPWIGDGKVFFAKVSCANGCGRIIQEIWLNDNTGLSRQITLENRLAHQPAYSPAEGALYYSAKTDTGYSIYRLWLNRGFCRGEEVTYEDGAADAWPNPDGDGGIYFIRTKGGKGKLMHLGKNGKTVAVDIGEKYHRIRNLKVYP